MLADTAHLVVGLITLGLALIFLFNDRDNPTTRALAVSLLAIVPTTFISIGQSVTAGNLILALIVTICEAVAMLYGVEWGRRIGLTATQKLRMGTAVNVLLRISQLLIIVYGGLGIGMLFIAPELTLSPSDGAVKAHGIQFAILAPVLGSSMLISGIAISLLLLLSIDKAEAVRLRALMLAGPVFLVSIIISKELEPLTMALGLVIFLAGSVRYLLIQSARGQQMRQFMSPEIAALLQADGVAKSMQRERRKISVVACDLRGFTAYAREADSEAVVKLLEDYYAKVGQIASRFGGTIKDHAGDGVLILVGAPISDAQHQVNAARLARAIAQESRDLLDAADQKLGLGVGVATGHATVGAIQGAGRLEYVAVGNVVNLAARLCDRAKDGEVLLDERTSLALKAEEDIAVEERQPEQLKGYNDPIKVFAL